MALGEWIAATIFIRPRQDGAVLWMSQIAPNLTDAVDGFFTGKRYLIHDRDPLYTMEFLTILADAGIQSVKLPPRSPNLMHTRRDS